MSCDWPDPERPLWTARRHKPTFVHGDFRRQPTRGVSWSSPIRRDKPRPGLRVALENPARVDDLFIDRTAQPVGERLHVLSGEGRLADTPPVLAGALPSLLEILRRRYKFLVCDAAWPASRIGRGLFDLGHQRVLVTEPSVAGARDVLRYLATPQAAQQSPAVPAGATLVVLNQLGIKGRLTLAQFEKATGRKPDLVIPHLKGALRTAADLGEPAAATVRPFRRAIAELAFRAGSVTDAAGSPRSRWRRR